jgi:hypothetical protein
MELKRANKLTIATEQGHMIGKFFLTHKEQASIMESETGFQPSPNATPTMVRETYRLYLMDNADKFGIKWDPEDRRTTDNLVPAKYPTESLLYDTACKLAGQDLAEFTAKLGVTLTGLAGDNIQPLSAYKDKVVSPKYANGNWAYAKVTLAVTVTKGDKEAYLMPELLLVSGQLKKPNWNLTSVAKELATDLDVVIPNQPKKEPNVTVMTSKEFLDEVEDLKKAN